MSDTNSPPRSPPPTERRRSSFAGQAFADLFGRQPNGPSPNSNGNSNANYQGPITSAAAQANRRRLSLTTLGLSGSPNQPSPFNAMRSRGESVSSATSGSFNESPFDDDDTSSSNSPPNTAATSPFARRLSFGARALRDVKQGNGSGNTSANGRARPNASSKSPTPSTNITATKGRDGFNFAENMRTRAERSSISAASPGRVSPPMHHRAKSIATAEPIREVPKVAKAPDAFQERILKGDFYMD
ncbi:hypothetical protein GTA08_BOTSDO02963 [Botryosphaeria dothidea]|uniref:Uncharacterized protein n=1 Tax=Botryosphaeria dothidea TaxID=55169 RepID=A0A8H4N739_9PEZI|nr:hypothetical protein GTA08_BOTSDO02963 [Botryosphaeria dothidea]